MNTVPLRRWSPPQSHIAIEFPPGLPSEIRLQTEQDHERGVLFGSAKMAAAAGSSRVAACEIRAITALRDRDSTLVNGQVEGPVEEMEQVGVYICRERGEIFLTDDDLVYMDRFQVPVALVIAGTRAGFFVRQSNGLIQAVRSYEEFATTDSAPLTQRIQHRPPRVQPPEPHRDPPRKAPAQATTTTPVKAARKISRWLQWRAGLLALTLLAIPIGAIAYLRPMLRDLPIPISLQQNGRQLVASWNPSVSRQGGQLEINDAGVSTILEIAPGVASATYERHPSSRIGKLAFQETITVRLSAGRRTGTAQWSQPYLDAPVQQPALPHAGRASERAEDTNATRQQLAELEQQVKKLRLIEANRSAQIVELSKLTEQFLNPSQSPVSTTQLAQWYKASATAKPAQ